jgi:hypothetical protein
MTAAAKHLQELSPAERSELEAWLLEFEQSWDEKRLADRVRRLPRDTRRRRVALIEMVKIDLERRWQTGRKVTVEGYLKALPELGDAATVPVELLLAEYVVRRQFGVPCAPAAFGKRFPRVYPTFRRRLGEVEGNGAAKTAAAAASPGSPATARGTTWRSRGRWFAAAAVVAGILGTFAVLGRGWFGPRSQPGALRPDEPVQTLTVTLHVGPGEDLKERVALDLGLGFPLWLEPVGSRSTGPVPFGAVPQQTTASDKVPAGASATFTFAAQGEPGQDALQTSPHLLAGVRVSDIARVGFTSLGSGNWELAGYEVKINDKTFLDNRAVHRKAKDAQQQAKARLAELGLKGGPLEKERADLSALAKTGLARADDTRRRNDVEAALAGLAPEKARLERQLRGQYPWHVEPAPASNPERDRALVKSARITVVTDTHGLADTRSYGYFRTGGHKYLIGGPDWPLTGDAGPQAFVLDLVAGPLTRDDLRGWALGLLGTPQAQSGPDRWHPRRLMVEIDGKVAYDSEQESLDRHSLEVIRLVPPCHLNEAGKPVLNPADQRQVHVWEAGKGLGWDEGKQEARPLPAGVAPEVKLPPSDAQQPAQDPMRNPVNESEPKKDPEPNPNPPSAPLFPGEWPTPPDTAPPAQAPAPPTVIVVGVFPQISNPPADQPGQDSDQPGQDPDNPDPGHDPSPAGPPFQIEKVRISSGNRTAGPYTIDWTVWGDESQVHHYEVYLDQITPSHLNPFDGASFTLATDVSRGLHTWTGYVDTGLADPHLFLAPRVVAVPVDPASTTPTARWGPARPIYPTGTISPPVGLLPHYWYGPPPVSMFTVPPTIPPMLPPPGIHSATRSWTHDPAPLSSRAVWTVGESSSHWGINFDIAFPGKNAVLRPSTAGPGTERLRVWLLTGPILDTTSARTVAADMGFNGGGMANQAKARLFCYKVKPFGPLLLSPSPAFYNPAPAGLPVNGASPMVPLDCVIPAGGPAYRLLIGIEVENFVGDPAYPPALWGVRVVPSP